MLNEPRQRVTNYPGTGQVVTCMIGHWYALGISTTNLAACVCPQNLTNFCPHAFISSPNVPKILFA